MEPHFMLTDYTIVLVLMCIMLGCEASPSPHQAIQIKLLESVQAEFVDSGEILPEVITISRSSGKYVEVRMIPRIPMPANVDGKLIQEFGRWPMAFLVFPVGKISSSPETIVLFFQPYSAGSIAAPPSGPEFVPVAFGISPFSSENGYAGEPKTSRKLREGEFARWTYLNVPRKLMAKEMAYELVAWPCFEQTKFSETKFGRPLVLQTGRVQLQE